MQSDTLLLADVFGNFRNMSIKVYELDPTHFLSAPGLAWQACLKKTEVELELLIDADMLLMVEKRIRGGICHAIHRYAKANNKYMKNYDEDEESSYIQDLDANNLYGWVMSQKLPVNSFKWIKTVSKIDEDFMKNYGEDRNIGYFLNVDIEYPKQLHDLHSDLPFLPERMKINKCNKLLCNLYDKNNYIVHIRALKQALKHGLKLKKVHKVIQFNQKAWLKKYFYMKNKLRKKAKNEFERDFFKLMNNAVFGKTMENVRKHRYIKLVATDNRRNQLVSEPNYHATKWFSENLLATEMKKIKVKINKPVYLGLSMLDISKTLTYKFWYDYIKPKFGDNVKLCYTDTDSFIMYIKTGDFYEDITDHVEKTLDTSNYEVNRPLPTGENKMVIGLMKDELGGRIMTEIGELRPKTYAYLTDDDSEVKKAIGTKKCVIKRVLKFNDYKDCLLKNEIALKPILMTILMKLKQSIIQSGLISLFIHTEYLL